MYECPGLQLEFQLHTLKTLLRRSFDLADFIGLRDAELGCRPVFC